MDWPPEMDELLTKIDGDGSGQIDYIEFVAATMDREKSPRCSRIHGVV